MSREDSRLQQGKQHGPKTVRGAVRNQEQGSCAGVARGHVAEVKGGRG